MPSKPKAVFDSSGNLTVTLDRPYGFRQPKGRDLATIQRSLKDDSVPVEVMAVILSALSTDMLTVDEVLDMPAETLNELGGLVTNSFPVFNQKAV
ncbi:MAG: phage tail assembly protein [Trichormus sp. ATA11-4-KO1]|jgi:hypothetical protein|nr:phage tail assembly protein [Trichormus sp. ATA11-4-KO1]